MKLDGEGLKDQGPWMVAALLRRMRAGDGGKAPLIQSFVDMTVQQCLLTCPQWGAAVAESGRPLGLGGGDTREA